MERPLLWHQGLFLQPQHFQLADLYHQDLLGAFTTYQSPHFWGVARMEILSSPLGGGTLQLTSGAFVFPDMTYCSIPDNAVVEARSFTQAWTDGGRPLGVYLGLRRMNALGHNVTSLSGALNATGVHTRFAAPDEPEEVRDLHENGPAAQVRKLTYVLKIFWESEKDYFGDYEIIPLARLERQGAEVVISQTYIPPCIAMSASPVLTRIMCEIRDQIASRGMQLEAFKRERGIHTADFGSRDMVFLLTLRSLNRYIPQLYQLIETGCHPWILYGLLRSLIGELSSFSERYSVSGTTDDGLGEFPAYSHQGLWECFSRAQSVITTLLEEITAGPDYIFALLYDGAYFCSDLPPAVFDGHNRFYLVLETGTDPLTVMNDLKAAAKLSSRVSLPLLIVHALPGVRLDHLERVPQELPRRANALYFQIDHHGEHWANVHKDGNAALFWDNAPQDLKIELMAVGKR